MRPCASTVRDPYPWSTAAAEFVARRARGGATALPDRVRRLFAMFAHATRPDDHVPTLARNGVGGGSPLDGGELAVTFIRYIDVLLVVAAAPFVLLASLPAGGYGIGAGAWIVTRLAVWFLERRAWAATDGRVRAALHLGSILGRVWLIALAVLAARFAAGTDDGITAAVVVLAAYTTELVVKFLLRGSISAGLRRGA